MNILSLELDEIVFHYPCWCYIYKLYTQVYFKMKKIMWWQSVCHRSNAKYKKNEGVVWFIVVDCLGCEVRFHFIFVTIERSLRKAIFMFIFVINHSVKYILFSYGKNVIVFNITLPFSTQQILVCGLKCDTLSCVLLKYFIFS